MTCGLHLTWAHPDLVVLGDLNRVVELRLNLPEAGVRQVELPVRERTCFHQGLADLRKDGGKMTHNHPTG